MITLLVDIDGTMLEWTDFDSDRPCLIFFKKSIKLTAEIEATQNLIEFLRFPDSFD